PEALLADGQLPDKDGLAIASSEVRVLALRSDDFREICEDDAELGEVLLAALAAEIALRKPGRRRVVVESEVDVRGVTDPGDRASDTEPLRRTTTDRGSPPPRPPEPPPIPPAASRTPTPLRPPAPAPPILKIPPPTPKQPAKRADEEDFSS